MVDGADEWVLRVFLSVVMYWCKMYLKLPYRRRALPGFPTVGRNQTLPPLEISYGDVVGVGLGAKVGVVTGDLIGGGDGLVDFGGVGNGATPGTFLSAMNRSNRLLSSSKIALVTPKLLTA